MDKEIKVGQELYYQGLGYGIKTHCYEIFKKGGVRYVHSNNGVIRREVEVLNNSCDLYSNKDKINESLLSSYKSKLIE